MFSSVIENFELRKREFNIKMHMYKNDKEMHDDVNGIEQGFTALSRRRASYLRVLCLIWDIMLARFGL